MAILSAPKFCKKHGVPKELRANGTRGGKPYSAYVCVLCKNETAAKWREHNPEQQAAYHANYRLKETYKDKEKNHQLLNKYGITLTEYNAIFMAQEGRCAGCEKHQSEFKRALCVDHCHKTDKVRGLLCDDCNIVLGRIRESYQTLYNLAEYLHLHSDDGGGNS